MDVDLFGRPIPENWGKPGRPPHIPTLESRGKVRIGCAEGWPDWRIAGALGISEPTLKKYYFRELRERDQARDARFLAVKYASFASACGGNVGAQKEELRRHDRFALEEVEREMRGRQTASEPKLGKKEQRERDARSVDGIYAPPPAPDLLN